MLVLNQGKNLPTFNPSQSQVIHIKNNLLDTKYLFCHLCVEELHFFLLFDLHWVNWETMKGKLIDITLMDLVHWSYSNNTFICLFSSDFVIPPPTPPHLAQSQNSPSVQFSHSVVSDSLWHHELQHDRLPCSSLTPGACSNSCPSSQWCHLAISSSVIPFSNSPWIQWKSELKFWGFIPLSVPYVFFFFLKDLWLSFKNSFL